MKVSEKYICFIKNLYNEKVSIYQPTFIGEHHPIYIVETTNNKFIYRFSSKDCAFKNFHTSRILRKYNIPVPEISVYRIYDKYCETYPVIPGKTLYERHKEGISQQTIKKIYTQLCDICYRISQIPVNEVKDLNIHTSKVDTFFKILNKSPRVIGHCDLSDKNILLNQNDDVCAIIDLDDISLKTFELILINLFKCAKEKGYGYDVADIKDFFPSKYHSNSLLNLSAQYNIYKKIIGIKNKFIKNKHLLQQEYK